MVAIFLAGLALAPTAIIATRETAPPPMIVSVQPPMPPPIMRVASVAQPRVVIPIRVRITAGSQVLFEDTLRVARGASASFSQNRSEAPETLCSAERYYGAGDRQSLSVQLYLRDDLEGAPGLNVSVNWQRPSGTARCGAEGTRTVSLSESVPFAAGQSATLRGDGGLVVTLSRR